jgi:hypothetical protein
MGARVYDPYTGAFLQTDPIQGGSANAYGYTSGDPVNELDLTGDYEFLADAQGGVILPGGDDSGPATAPTPARLGDLYADGNVPSEADLHDYAQSQGWRLAGRPTGPPTYVDENGVKRLTIKSGSAQTPGSEGPHIEVRNASGLRTDPFGNEVTRKSDGNHYPYRR